MYGNSISRSAHVAPAPSVIGEVETSIKGNVILRVGRLADDRSHWSQTEHVVMTPDETIAFVCDLVANAAQRLTDEQCSEAFVRIEQAFKA